MKVPSPLYISSRLMAAYDLTHSRCADGGHATHAKRPNGDCVTAKLGTIHVERNSGDRYGYVIEDEHGNELATGSDLRCPYGGYVEAVGALLSFLSAAAESYDYRMRTGREGENEDLFPAACVEWAYEHSDAIGYAQMEFDEERAAEEREG